MKKIVFNNLALKSWNLLFVVIIFFLVIFSLLVSFEAILIQNKALANIFSKLGLVTLVFYYSKALWFKNYVEWNELGINLKLNRFLPTNFKFKDIDSILTTEKKFTIIKNDGTKKSFSTNNITKQDLSKLHHIILNHKCL